jgi:hypothetical protein
VYVLGGVCGGRCCRFRENETSEPAAIATCCRVMKEGFGAESGECYFSSVGLEYVPVLPCDKKTSVATRSTAIYVYIILLITRCRKNNCYPYSYLFPSTYASRVQAAGLQAGARRLSRRFTRPPCGGGGSGRRRGRRHVRVCLSTAAEQLRQTIKNNANMKLLRSILARLLNDTRVRTRVWH